MALMATIPRPLPPGDPRHGLNGYNHYGCRCAMCRAAKAAGVRRRTFERARLLDAGLVDPPHGTVSTYQNYRCRCALCTAAASCNHKARQSRQPRPSREQLDAARALLARLGAQIDDDTAAQIAEQHGLPPEHLRQAVGDLRNQHQHQHQQHDQPEGAS